MASGQGARSVHLLQAPGPDQPCGADACHEPTYGRDNAEQLRVEPDVRSLKTEFLEGRSCQLNRVASGMDAVLPRRRDSASMRGVDLEGSDLNDPRRLSSLPPPVRRGRPPSNARSTNRLTRDKPTRTATGQLPRSVRILGI
jgi:hypothetical protein